MAVIDTTDGHNTLHAIHADHLGTPRVITDGEGKTVWSWSLHDDPFGENAPTSTSGYTFHLRFAGQYYDQETGLYYNVQRYYDPTVGRYLTSDPLGLSAGINTYSYVSSNALSYVDPFGLKKFPAVIAEGGGGAGLFGGSGGMIVVADPSNLGSIYAFGYAGGNVGLGIPGNAYGALQLAEVDANSPDDISSWGWYASGGLASPSGGVSGTYSGAFWFQDTSYSIKSIGGAAGAVANVGVGVSYTWKLNSLNVEIPQSVRDALEQAVKRMEGCE